MNVNLFFHCGLCFWMSCDDFSMICEAVFFGCSKPLIFLFNDKILPMVTNFILHITRICLTFAPLTLY